MANSHFCFFLGGFRLPQKKTVLFGHVQMVDCLTHLGGVQLRLEMNKPHKLEYTL